MATGVKIKTKKGGREIARLSKLSGSPSVLVGVLAGSGTHPKSDSATLAEVAYWMEYGTPTAPPRPTLRPTIVAHSYYRREFGLALGAYLRGDGADIQLLSVIGIRAAADVRSAITALMDPPNAESTQRQKAAKSHVTADLVDNPLINSGAFRAAVNSEVKK